MDRFRRAGRRCHRDESGNGPVSTIAGVMIFLGFLLLAVQTTIHLYAVSTSTALLFDEARRVAADGGYTCAQAETNLRDNLGAWGDELTVVDCVDDPTVDSIAFRVRGPSPANLVAGFGSATGLDTFQRTVRVTREEFRP